MKKIYMVYGCGGNHYFEDKESAIKLLKMDKDYMIEAINMYENFEDFKNIHKDSYPEALLNAIKQTKERLEEYQSGNLRIYEKSRNYFVHSKSIETILKDKKLPNNDVYYFDKEMYYCSEDDREYVEEVEITKDLEEKYLDVFVTACKKALMRYEELKQDLKNYKAEYKNLRKNKNVNAVSEDEDIK